MILLNSQGGKTNKFAFVLLFYFTIAFQLPIK